MATVPSFTISTQGDGKAFIFTDTTGAYSITNTSGYDEDCVLVGTNIKTADVTTCTIVTTTPTLDIYTKGVSGTLPDLSAPSTLITNTNLGIDSDTVIPDGYYIFNYNLSGINTCDVLTPPFALITQVRYFNLFTIQCQVDRLFKDVKAQMNCELEELFETILKAQTYLEAIKNAAECGMVNKAIDLLSKTQALINSLNCPNCNCN